MEVGATVVVVGAVVVGTAVVVGATVVIGAAVVGAAVSELPPQADATRTSVMITASVRIP